LGGKKTSGEEKKIAWKRKKEEFGLMRKNLDSLCAKDCSALVKKPRRRSKLT